MVLANISADMPSSKHVPLIVNKQLLPSYHRRKAEDRELGAGTASGWGGAARAATCRGTGSGPESEQSGRTGRRHERAGRKSGGGRGSGRAQPNGAARSASTAGAKDMCKDCGGTGICQHNREHLHGVLLVYHIVCPYMDLREEVEQMCLVYIMMCAHVQVALCMHIYTHTHCISQCKRTTPKTHTCRPPPNVLPPYRAPSLSLIPSLCL